MAQLSEPLARAAIDLIRTERKLGLTLNEVDQALHGWLSWNSELSGRSVTIPKNADQAELMAKVGIAWLETHAPERLKQPTKEPSREVPDDRWIKHDDVPATETGDGR